MRYILVITIPGFRLDSFNTTDRKGSSSNVYEVNMWLWHFGRGRPH